MLHLGWAVQDITPSRPAMLHGQMHRRIASKAIDRLLVTALAIEGGDPTDCAILVSCDLCLVPDELQRAVRDRLAARSLGIPLDRVFLAATHTHTSLVLTPGEYEYPGGEVMAPEECLALVADRAADAAEQAWTGRTPHRYASAFAQAVVGHNRRAVYADGSAEMYGRTDREDFMAIEGYEDHSLDLLFWWDADGRLDGVTLGVPCPSQVDENLEAFSADYWDDVRSELRARWGKGLQVLPLCGAAGDVSPHFIVYGKQEEEMRRRRGVSERREIAQRIAEGVARALACTKPVEGEIAFRHAVRRLELPPRQVTKEERDRAAAEYPRMAGQYGAESWWARGLQDTIERFDGSKQSDDPVVIEIHVLRIGEVVLATNPFELYSDFGMRIKARSPAAQTVIVQLAAGCGWYLPTEQAVCRGGYGAIPPSSKVGPEGGRQLVEETLATVERLFSVRP